MNAEVYTAH